MHASNSIVGKPVCLASICLLMIQATLSPCELRAMEQRVGNSIDSVTEAESSVPPFPSGSGLNSGGTGSATRTFSPVESIQEINRRSLERILNESREEERESLTDILATFIAFVFLATQDEPPSIFADPPQLTQRPEEATIQGAVVAKTDPFLGRTLRITNPFDEAILYRLETSIDIDALDNASAFSEATHVAEIFDTGGDPGAELTYNVGYTLRQIDSGERLSAPIFFGGTVVDGEVGAVNESDANFGLGEDFDEILQSAFLTISPGDTAVVTSIATFGDADTPLIPLELIGSALAIVDEFGAGVPEPSAAIVLMTAGLLFIPTRRSPPTA